jgi:hypothetical protein
MSLVESTRGAFVAPGGRMAARTAPAATPTWPSAPTGPIFCFYERGTASNSHYNPRSLCLARFRLEWLTGGCDTLDPATR